MGLLSSRHVVVHPQSFLFLFTFLFLGEINLTAATITLTPTPTPVRFRFCFRFRFLPSFFMVFPLAKVSHVHGTELRKKLKIVFNGEEGVDEGGVAKEFFQLLTVQVMFCCVALGREGGGGWARLFPIALGKSALEFEEEQNAKRPVK